MGILPFVPIPTIIGVTLVEWGISYKLADCRDPLAMRLEDEVRRAIKSK